MTKADVAAPLRGTVRVPPDKSISHRAAILAAFADGDTVVHNYSPAGDCRATLEALAALGVEVGEDGASVVVRGLGPRLPAAAGPVDCARSGTTMRLLAGALAGYPVRVELTGDEQLRRRPMERVAEPLRLMGAEVRTNGGLPPVEISGGTLRGARYRLPVASAQVKSAMLLAGLRAAGPSTVVEPAPTRDHTERLLAAMGAEVHIADRPDGGRAITLAPGRLRAARVGVPGDLSSAGPLLAAAAMVPGSDVTIEGVGVNPTRTGFVDVLRRMGADLELYERAAAYAGEPIADIRIRHAPLRAAEVPPEEVPRLIDELPLVGLVATAAEGVTRVRGAGELRVKESDRIAGLVAGLRALGADIDECQDGFRVRGPSPLHGAEVDSLNDHRLAMTFAVAGLIASGPVHVAGLSYVADSFPGFVETLGGLR